MLGCFAILMAVFLGPVIYEQETGKIFVLPIFAKAIIILIFLGVMTKVYISYSKYYDVKAVEPIVADKSMLKAYSIVRLVWMIPGMVYLSLLIVYAGSDKMQLLITTYRPLLIISVAVVAAENRLRRKLFGDNW